jgi:hypothetical protein
VKEPSVPEGYELEFSEEFEGVQLDPRRWIPAHLPHWSSRVRSAARYRSGNGHMALRIEQDQQPWCPEFDGTTKVSSLQTGVFSGPVGSAVGQHRFTDRAVVREAQTPERLYTPQYGYFEVRAKALADPANMVAFWMIGFEDAPDRSGEICVFEVFGRDVGRDGVRVGMGVHPFSDPRLVDDFERVALDIDSTEYHTYAAAWQPTQVEFLVDDQLVKTVRESPSYPMQLMLGIYEFGRDGHESAGQNRDRYPKEFHVDYVRGHRLLGEP